MWEVERMSVLKQAIAIVCVGAMMSTLGCYTTYVVPQAEFEKLQVFPEDRRAVVQAQDGSGVEVTEETPVYVRSAGGRRYAVTPFNFKMTSTQLVASDRDTLLALGDIGSFEIDHLSVGLTATVIATGVAAVAGLIAYTIISTGDKSFSQ